LEAGRVEALRGEEVEHRRSTVVADRVVGGAGKAVRGIVVDGPVAQSGEPVELGEPAGDHRTQGGCGWAAQEGTTLTELAVLVAAAQDPGIFQPGFAQGEDAH